MVTGFRDVKIEDARVLFEHLRERVKGGHVQLFDANLVASWEHLFFAAVNALRAFKTSLNISNDPAVEALLYASGQHQIRKAVELLGVKPSSSSVAVLIMAATGKEANETLTAVSDLLQGRICDQILEVTKEKTQPIKEFFGISDLELEASSRGESLEKTLTNIVIEHVALLAARR